jgi:tetratricopeptide (TPR) repeat protein
MADLSMLPEAERPAVDRALAKVPRQRWTSCREFVEALRANRGGESTLIPLTRRPNGSEGPHVGRAIPGLAAVALVTALGLTLWWFARDAVQTNPPARREAEVYCTRADSRFRAGDNAGAIADFDAAIRLDPEYAPAYRGRGNVYRNQGDFAPAFADYDAAIRLAPSDASSYYHRGLTRYRVGDDAGAIADFDAAIRVDPSLATAYASRGNAYDRLGDRERAKADHDRAAELRSGSGARPGASDGGTQEIPGGRR